MKFGLWNSISNISNLFELTKFNRTQIKHLREHGRTRCIFVICFWSLLATIDSRKLLQQRDALAADSDGKFPEIFTGAHFPETSLQCSRIIFSRLFFNRFIYVTVIL
jgi:hypothetical protein